MATIVDSQTSQSLNKQEELHELNLKLDDLFARYLNLLDQYQTARKQLSTELSSGYFSLAQANFSSSSGRRYGQDFYDQRMQASRRITIRETENGSEQFIVTNSAAASEPDEKKEDSLPSVDPEEVKDPEKSATRSVNPLYWYGILVPPALRSAQSHFVSATVGPILRVTALSKELRYLEIEIGRTRKATKKLDKV